MTTFTPTPSSPPHHRAAWIGALIASLLALAALALVFARESADDRSTTLTTMVGSGTTASDTRSVVPFTGVELAGANDVTVHAGGIQSVVVRGDDNLVEHVTTEVRGGALVIGADRSFETRTPMSVEVTVPWLDSVRLIGSGRMIVNGVQAVTFTAALPGSGTLRVSGTTVRLDARLAGSGELRADDLIARDATAVLAGAGRLYVHAAGSLDASLSGVGQIVYVGEPAAVSTQVTGTGVITPG